MGDLPPPDYATVVIEADRRQQQQHEEETDDDIYLEPRDALNNFPMRGAAPLVATEVGSYSLDLGT